MSGSVRLSPAHEWEQVPTFANMRQYYHDEVRRPNQRKRGCVARFHFNPILSQ